MSSNHEASGIGPFKFKNKKDFEIESFANVFKDKNYKFQYEPENQERLNYISNSLFYYNLIEKYTINPITRPVNANSQFNYEKTSSSGYQNTVIDNIKKEPNVKDSHNKLHNWKDDNFNKNNKLLNNKTETQISKYFKTNNSSNHSFVQNSNIISNETSSQNNRKGKNIVEDNETFNQTEEDNNTPKIFSEILKNVTIVISGIQNPERGIIRNLAIEMGAKYEPQWSDSSTHLICPIKGTPKYNEVKEQGRGIIVKPEWIYKCYEKKKRLLEKYYSFQKQISNSSDDENQPMDNKTIKRKFIDNNDTKKISKDHIINKNNDNIDTDTLIDNIDNDKLKKLKQVNYILNIPDIFKNLYFFFDKTILEKTKNELERYVLGHGGKVLNNVNKKVTHYCTMKAINEVIIPSDVNFKGSIINPSYIINCHNQNCIL